MTARSITVPTATLNASSIGTSKPPLQEYENETDYAEKSPNAEDSKYHGRNVGSRTGCIFIIWAVSLLRVLHAHLTD
jgi:hypothetical protein